MFPYFPWYYAQILFGNVQEHQLGWKFKIILCLIYALVCSLAFAFYVDARNRKWLRLHARYRFFGSMVLAMPLWFIADNIDPYHSNMWFIAMLIAYVIIAGEVLVLSTKVNMRG